MHWIYRNRASAILYEFLITLDKSTVFLLPSNSCPILIATFCKAGIKVRLTDIDDQFYLINPSHVFSSLEDAKTPLGLLFIRTYGFINDQSNFFSKIKSQFPNTVIIDDRCLAIPSFEVDEISDPNVDLILFSSGYSKVVELGFGGYGLTQKQINPRKHANLEFNKSDHQLLIDHFRDSLDNDTPFEYPNSNWLDLRTPANSFLDYQSQVTSGLHDAASHKSKINAIYHSEMSGNPSIQLLSPSYWNWRFCILSDKKEQILKNIFSNNYFASSHYQPVDPFLGFKCSPVAFTLHQNVINLFNDFRITVDDAHSISDIVNHTVS